MSYLGQKLTEFSNFSVEIYVLANSASNYKVNFVILGQGHSERSRSMYFFPYILMKLEIRAYFSSTKWKYGHHFLVRIDGTFC